MKTSVWEGRRKFQVCFWDYDANNWRALPVVYDRFRDARAYMTACSVERGLELYSEVMVYSTTTIAKCGIAA